MADPPAATAATVAAPAAGVDTQGDSDRRMTAQLISNHYLIRFGEDTLKHRPLWVRVIVEFVGTFMLVTVAAEPS